MPSFINGEEKILAKSTCLLFAHICKHLTFYTLVQLTGFRVLEQVQFGEPVAREVRIPRQSRVRIYFPGGQLGKVNRQLFDLGA